MFSYSQIARWLKRPLDPITVEDWVANREVFGESKGDEDLEQAYQIEKARERGLGETAPEDASLDLLLNGYEVANVLEKDNFVIIAPVGKPAQAEVWIYGEKVEKKNLPAREVTVIEIDPGRTTKIKVRGKNNLEWSGKDFKKVVFDLRGRPLPL